MTRAIALAGAMPWFEALALPADEAIYFFRDALRDAASHAYEQDLLRYAILKAGGAEDLKAPRKAEY